MQMAECLSNVSFGVWRVFAGQLRMRLKFWIMSARPPVFSARKDDFDNQI